MPDPADTFWTVAATQLELPGVERGTMMGFPCLRVNGAFFASCEPRSGDLIVKLSADCVTALIEAGDGIPFAPNGRRFREWLRVTERSEERWAKLISEAKAFVAE